MYKILLKYYLKKNSPSRAFKIATDILATVGRMPFGRNLLRAYYKNRVSTGKNAEVFGLEFSHPVGLASSIDTEGIFYNLLSDFGFSFIEIGPLSYVEQDYCTSPRHYVGVKKAIEHLREDKPDCIVAGNISQNPQSKGADIVKDFEKAFALLYDFVDMIVINPYCGGNEDDEVRGASELPEIIDRLLTMRMYYDTNKPVLVRLVPQLSHAQTDEIIEYCLSSGVDGVVAGSVLRSDDDSDGTALFRKNINFIRHINEKSTGLMPIIGVGGVMNAAQAQEMLDAGASLIEVYTGFFREGPSIVRNIVNGLDVQGHDTVPKAE